MLINWNPLIKIIQNGNGNLYQEKLIICYFQCRSLTQRSAVQYSWRLRIIICYFQYRSLTRRSAVQYSWRLRISRWRRSMVCLVPLRRQMEMSRSISTLSKSFILVIYLCMNVHRFNHFCATTWLEGGGGFLSPAGAVGPGSGDIATPPRPSVRPSVCLSVRHVCFSHCNSKTHYCIFSKLCRYVHQVMGVCSIVFYIDGMLFEFFKYWKKKVVKKTISGGGGGSVEFFFLEKHFFIISFCILCYFQHLKNLKYWKVPLHLLVKGRWFLQIVDRDSGNLYPI